MFRPDGAVVDTANNYNAFMGLSQEVRMRPMDHITAGIAPREAFDLVRGCAVVADIVEKERPHIVFVPLRGAGPIEWTTDAILEQRDADRPLFVELPLGTHRNAETKEPSGLKGRQKIQLLDAAVQRLADAGLYTPGESRLMLVDEVQKGGTITQASEALRRAVQDRGDHTPISVVAVQDSRGQMIGDRRHRGYTTLASNERADFRTFVLPTALFTVDRERYLDALAYRPAARDSNILDQFTVIRNDESRALFRSLARAMLDPSTAQDELAMLRRQEIAPALANTILQGCVLEAITDPRTVIQPTRDGSLLNWWGALLRIAQTHP